MKKVVSQKKSNLAKWRCGPCRWIYDPAIGDPTQNIPPGVAFEDLPDTWRCPPCKEGKKFFTKIIE